jgi:anti-sigma regulatory factor (Ser/Thr protein kinase)
MSGSTGAASSCPPALGRPTRESPVRRPSDYSFAFPGRPLVSRLELGALPSAVPCARLHTKVILKEWCIGHMADDAEIIVSELTTNALKASWSANDSTPIALHLLASHDCLAIQVWDSVPAAPDPQPHTIDAETGRGLEIVSLLSDRWGLCHPDTGGKIVWAALEISTALGACQRVGA